MARIIVYGAGAIGGVTGAALANAGHDVLLVDQVVDHVAAMNAKGLTVRTKDGAWNARVRAVTPDALPDTLDLVLVAVKAHSTDAALDRLAPLLGADGAIVSLQNDDLAGWRRLLQEISQGQARDAAADNHDCWHERLKVNESD